MNLLNVDYEKYTLRNGLEIILHQNKSLPIVSVNIWYKAGSANERKGKTGIAHLFEHMMFQGSQNVAKEMHFKYIQEAGGSLNGSTSFDRTNYYEKVPSNFLELVLWLESDRMGYLLPAITQEKLNNQKDVVTNERLERYDNQPYGLAWEKLIANIYPEGHPYNWPTIGYAKDIASFTLDDVNHFFNTYYAPANASLVIAGDFEKEKAKDLLDKYFGDIHGGKFVALNIEDAGPLKNNNLIIYKENVQLERIYLAWRTGKTFSHDDAALDILADILSGSKNARLYKNLVYDKEIAQDVTAYQYSGKYAGHFMIIATAKPGISIDTIKSEIFYELKKLCDNGINSRELLRSKNGIKSSFIYSMQNIDNLADQLNYYNYILHEPNSFNQDLSRYENVTEDDIKRAAEYLFKSFVELRIIPEDNES
ncbi:MAG: pitrilysin family protein [Ignavibacteriaceae bacterium]